MTPDMLDPRQQLTMGQDTARFHASLEPSPVARAYGDNSSPDLAVNPDLRQAARPAFPGHGGQSFGRGGGISNGGGGATSFGGLRYQERQQPSPFPDGIGGSGSAYGGGFADGVLIVRDRHVMTRFGHVRNAGGGGSSMPSREGPGLPPPMPEYQMVNTTESWQLGTDHMANEDNTGQHNSVDVTGTAKRFPLGQQDGTETPVFGPPIGEWREYGVRGTLGMHGPDPDIWDPNWIPKTGAGGSGGRGRLVAAGAPGMQSYDMRTVYGGVPHGLHSPTSPSLLATSARQASIPQMTAPRVDRPASSKVAGQSMSQMFPPEAASGAQGVQRAVPRTIPERRPGLDGRFRGRS